MLSACPRLLGSVGTVSYRFPRKGSSPWWGLWAPGHERLPAAVSLSFNELMPVELLGPPPPPSKGFRTCSEGLQGDCPPSSTPQLRVSAQPHSSGHSAFNITPRAPADGGNTPSLGLGVYMCALSRLFLLTSHKSR